MARHGLLKTFPMYSSLEADAMTPMGEIRRSFSKTLDDDRKTFETHSYHRFIMSLYRSAKQSIRLNKLPKIEFQVWILRLVSYMYEDLQMTDKLDISDRSVAVFHTSDIYRLIWIFDSWDIDCATESASANLQACHIARLMFNSLVSTFKSGIFSRNAVKALKHFANRRVGSRADYDAVASVVVSCKHAQKCDVDELADMVEAYASLSYHQTLTDSIHDAFTAQSYKRNSAATLRFLSLSANLSESAPKHQKEHVGRILQDMYESVVHSDTFLASQLRSCAAVWGSDEPSPNASNLNGCSYSCAPTHACCRLDEASTGRGSECSDESQNSQSGLSICESEFKYSEHSGMAMPQNQNVFADDASVELQLPLAEVALDDLSSTQTYAHKRDLYRHRSVKVSFADVRNLPNCETYCDIDCQTQMETMCCETHTDTQCDDSQSDTYTATHTECSEGRLYKRNKQSCTFDDKFEIQRPLSAPTGKTSFNNFRNAELISNRAQFTRRGVYTPDINGGFGLHGIHNIVLLHPHTHTHTHKQTLDTGRHLATHTHKRLVSEAKDTSKQCNFPMSVSEHYCFGDQSTMHTHTELRFLLVLSFFCMPFIVLLNILHQM